MAEPLSEAQAMQEYMALHADPVLNGQGVPQGDGSSVLVLPGLFGNDLYLATIRTWLTRIGYKPVASNILWNVGCPRRLLENVGENVAKLLADSKELITSKRIR